MKTFVRISVVVFSLPMLPLYLLGFSFLGLFEYAKTVRGYWKHIEKRRI